MVKCLIRISTRVNVHLRMINHCYRDVKVRVLSLGPRLLGKALGVLPLYPAIASQQDLLQACPLPTTATPSVLFCTSPGAVCFYFFVLYVFFNVQLNINSFQFFSYLLMFVVYCKLD